MNVGEKIQRLLSELSIDINEGIKYEDIENCIHLYPRT